MNDSLTATVELTTVPDAAVKYQFEVFRGKAGLTAIREDWSQITQALNNPRFFQRNEWYESYLDTLAESDSSTYFVLSRHQNLPAGVVPLVQAHRKIVGLRLRSLELPHHPHM